MAIRFPTKQEMRGRLKVLRRKTALLGWGSLAAAIVWALDGWSRLDLAWSIARQAWEVSGPFAQIFLDAVLTPLGLGLFGLGWLTLLVVRPVVKSHSDVAHAGARVSLSSSRGVNGEIQITVTNHGATATFDASGRIAKEILYPESHSQSAGWAWPTGTYSIPWVAKPPRSKSLIRSGDSRDLLLATTSDLYAGEDPDVAESLEGHVGMDLRQCHDDSTISTFHVESFPLDPKTHEPRFRWIIEIKIFSDTHDIPAIFEVELLLTTWDYVGPNIVSIKRRD